MLTNWFISYKSIVDLHEQMQKSQLEARKWLCFCLESLYFETVEILHVWYIGPYETLRKISLNAFKLDIPQEPSINPTLEEFELVLMHL